MNPEYIACIECGEVQAVNFGGLGTPESPWQWECTACLFVFTTNDESPEDDE